MNAAPRAVWRLAHLGAHLLTGLVITGLVLPWCSEKRRHAIRMHWSQDLLTIVGIEFDITGPPAPAAMHVANHISWLDVFLINAAAPVFFVCKSEVRRWPLIGWLAAKNGTLFIERNNARAAHEAVSTIAQRLNRGQSVVLFPEGTTTDGASVAAFRSALLEAAIEAAAPLQPLCIHYSDPRAAWCGEATLMQSLLAIARTRGLRAHLDFLPAVDAAHSARGLLAANARARISSALSRRTATETPADLPAAARSDIRPTSSPNPVT